MGGVEVGVTQRIGLFGGTFDPPHIAHLILGEYTAESLGLSTLLYVPAADPPHKQNEEKTPVEHRLAMLTLALAQNPRFAISRVDIDRPGPHYSADTVRIVHTENPDADIYFVIGGDSLRDLLTWHRPDLLIEHCKLAVLRRPGADVRPDMHADKLPGLADRVVMIDAPLLDISSTVIAQRLRDGRSVRYLVPDRVLAYIHENELYCS